VMGSPDYRQRAGQVADDVRAMASPAEVAEILATRYGHTP
jgi:hypothetical protein